MGYSYDYGYGYDYGSSGVDGIFGALAGAMVALWLIWIAIAVLTVIAMWKLFEKAGEPGWAALVPFYHFYVLFKISWGNGWFFLMPVGATILGSIFATLGSFGIVLNSLFSIFSFVIFVLTCVKLSKAFGKGGGWACGLIFLNTIFMCIMGLSKDIVYVGIPGKTAPNGAGYGQPGYQNPYSQGYQQPNGYQQQGYQAPNPQQGYQAAPPQQNAYQQPSAQNPEYYYQQPTASTGTKYCASCGAAVEPGIKFCQKCGKEQ